MNKTKTQFTTLTLRNFLSYGNNTTIFKFTESGTTLIVGEDLDDTANGQGANGVGKAQPLTSLLKTPTGWKKMGDVCIGDTLQTPDGSTTQVVGVFPQGKRPTYRLTFSDGRTSEADEEHLWQVQSHRWRENGKTNAVKILTTKEVKQFVDDANNKKKAWYNITIPTIVHPIVPDKKLPMDPYVLGALLGDGCLSTSTIRFSTVDDVIIQQLTESLSNTNGYFVKDTKVPDWRLNGTDIKSILEDLSLFGCKSNTKYVPIEYLEGTSETQKLRLLQGLLDTDGTVGKTKNVSFCSVSEQLALDVQYLVRSLGGKATISKRQPFFTYNGIKKNGKQAYNVSIQYKNPHDLFTLERKLDRLSDGQTQYANSELRIISVEQIESQECQCIMVDHPDHLYITDDFVVTHNTVVINALAYAIYDKTISDISKDNLVNNINGKKLVVTAEFKKNGHTYRIERYRKMKAGASGNYVKLFEDDIEVSRASAADTNKYIEHIIGINYDLFTRIVVFSATNTPFLDLPVRHPTLVNQTDMIEELFGLTELSEKAEKLKDNIKETKAAIKVHEIKIEQLESMHLRHKEQLKSAETRVVKWEQDHAKAINQLENDRKVFSTVDVDQQEALHANRKILVKEKRELEEQQTSIERSLKEVERDIKELTKELNHLNDDKCPYCLQDYTAAKEKIKEINTKLKPLIDQEKPAILAQLEEVDTKLNKVELDVRELNKLLHMDDYKAFTDFVYRGRHLNEKLEELQLAENPFIEPLEELEGVELEELNYDDINTAKDLLEHQNFLMKLLTKRDSFVRKVLLNKNLPFLNQRLQKYLSELGLPHKVEFTHELVAEISKFGRNLDFGNLSNGQRARVNFALALSFRDILQKLHAPINVCIMDELLDVGLDTPGINAAARMIKRKSRDENISMYVISHRDELNNAFDNVLTIQMTKGFSYIKDNL